MSFAVSSAERAFDPFQCAHESVATTCTVPEFLAMKAGAA
jgi:hypothetical protein